jgi:hypothetical protein
MTTFSLRPAPYPETPNAINIGDNLLYLTIKDNKFNSNYYLYFENEEIRVIDILYSVEFYYLNILNEYKDTTQNTNLTLELFKELNNSLNSLHNELLEIYNENNSLKTNTNKKVFELFNKELKNIT